MIAPTPFFADRGCHTRIYEEIVALQNMGHEILLCTYGLGRDVEGIKTVRTVNLPWYKKLSAGPSKTKFLLLPCLLITTLKTIKKFKPDIVHAHLHEGACIAKMCSIFYPKIKYVFDMQGSLTKEIVQHKFIKENGFLYKLFEVVEKMINSWFPIIVSSNRIVDELKDMNCDISGCTNVKDGVNTDIFKPMNADEAVVSKWGIDLSAPRVLYMGLLETYQGIEIMLDAFEEVKNRCDKVQFIIIGFPNIVKYKNICKEKGLEKDVIFLGKVEYSCLAEHLSVASIAVAPKISKTEGNGKIYNYMAMGMTTVSFDTKVSREILGDAGVYAKVGDKDDLADKILYCIENQEECSAIGRKARERAVETLSWIEVGRRIDEVYRKLTKK